MIATLIAIGGAWATCADWNANLRAQPARGATSSALQYDWHAAPSCDGFTLSHYLVCRNDGVIGTLPPAPLSPDDAGVSCEVVVRDASRTRAWDRVYHSNHAFAATIFACGDRACSTWYGDDGETVVTRTTAHARTRKERWVVGGVSGYTDDDRLVADHESSAATGFFYPSAFPDAGHLGVWYSTGLGGKQTLKYMVSRASGWGAWNDNGASFYPTVPVASSTDGDGVFAWVTHPWAVPAIDGGVPYVRLFVQADDDGSPGSGAPFQIFSVDSLDAAGVDFGLTCSGAACTADGGRCGLGDKCDWEDDSGDGGAAELEMGATGDLFSAYLTSASHGQVLFDYADGDGAIDFSAETPSLLFTGAADCYDDPDDLYLGTWDGVGWDVPTDGNGCPVEALPDAHDPSMIPQPDGSTKIYMQVGADAYQVCRYDGVIGDCEPIELAFDDGTPLGAVEPTLGACSDNFQAFADYNGRVPRQGALLHVMGNGVDCFDAKGGGIVTLELRN